MSLIQLVKNQIKSKYDQTKSKWMNFDLEKSEKHEKYGN